MKKLRIIALLLATLTVTAALNGCGKTAEVSVSFTEEQDDTAKESSPAEGLSGMSPDESSSVKPSESSEPDESAKPTETGKQTESDKPEESAKPTETEKQTESAKPEESAKPTETEKQTESAKPEESAKPTGTSKPTQSAKAEHTHNWQPVYRTIHHDAEYQKIMVPSDYIYHEIACGCGYNCGAVQYKYEIVTIPRDDFIETQVVRHLVSDKSMYAFDELNAHRAEEFSKAHAGVTYTKTLFTSAEGTEIWIYKCPVCDLMLMKEYKATGDTIYGDDPEEEWRKHTAVNDANVSAFVCTAAGFAHNSYQNPGHIVEIGEERIETVLFRNAYAQQVIDHYVCNCGQTWKPSMHEGWIP